MHSRSASVPQLFHSRARFAFRRASIARSIEVLIAVLACAGVPVASAQEPTHANSVYRVFLKDGQALPSYGEATRVDDRIVFNLSIAGANEKFALQLISLPATAVDVDRTTRYAEAVRAAGYASTRGDADYAAMSEEVARALGQLQTVENLPQRRALAALARQRLLDWSRAHYSYRANDIQDLADLFDGVAQSARVAPGATSLSVDLVAGPAVPSRESLRAAPDLRQSIELALVAAAVLDSPDERLAVLRAASEIAADGPADLRVRVAGLIEIEAETSALYSVLGASFRGRADAARRKGDVAAVEGLATELLDRDRQLGSRRPGEVSAIARDIAAVLDSTRTYRLALDHYAYVRPALLAYERRVRPALSALDGVMPILMAIRDMRVVAFAEVEAAAARLKRHEDAVRLLVAPDELLSVHATISGALELAREACARRRQAVVTNKIQTAREASSAAAGALLLAGAVRADLVAGLFPPKAP